MRPWKGRLLAGLLLPFSLCVQAEPIGYVATFSDLYRVDLATGAATRIGPIGFNDVDGLAISPDGQLYGVADLTAGSGSGLTDFLIRIDHVTGAGTQIGPLSGLANQGPGGSLDYGLAFTCDGRLWLSSDSTGSLWEVARGSGQVRLVADTGAPLSGLAARGRELFGIGVRQGFGDATQQATYRIDVETGRADRIGSLGSSDTLSGAGADFDMTGVLWATLDSQPPDFNRATRVARVDLATGAATVVASLTGIQDNLSARGLAIAPPAPCSVAGPLPPVVVPGPGAPLLFVLGAIAALFGARRLRAARESA